MLTKVSGKGRSAKGTTSVTGGGIDEAWAVDEGDLGVVDADLVSASGIQHLRVVVDDVDVLLLDQPGADPMAASPASGGSVGALGRRRRRRAEGGGEGNGGGTREEGKLGLDGRRGWGACFIEGKSRWERWHGRRGRERRQAREGGDSDAVSPFKKKANRSMMLGCFGWAKKERKRGMRPASIFFSPLFFFFQQEF